MCLLCVERKIGELNTRRVTHQRGLINTAGGLPLVLAFLDCFCLAVLALTCRDAYCFLLSRDI